MAHLRPTDIWMIIRSRVHKGLIALLLACGLPVAAQPLQINSIQQELLELLSVWQWQEYWQGRSPVTSNKGTVEGAVFVDGAGAGICSGELGVCCYYSRVWSSGPLNPRGLELTVSEQPDRALVGDFYRTRILRNNVQIPGVGERSTQTERGDRNPQTTSVKEIRPFDRLNPRMLDSNRIIMAQVRFVPPGRKVPQRTILPERDSDKATLLGSIIAGAQTARTECKFQSVDVPFVAESDGAAFVLIRGEGCAEIVHLLRWDSREWRFIDSRPVDIDFEQLIHSALWRTVEVNNIR